MLPIPARLSDLELMRIEPLGTSYLALPDGAGPHPGVVVIPEASGRQHPRDVPPFGRAGLHGAWSRPLRRP